MSITVYRGDGRSPDQIRQAGGFQPKGLHLSIATAQELVIRATLDSSQAVQFSMGRGLSIQNWLGSIPGLITINDLYTKVQSFGKDRDAFQVSTERGEDGGGQGGGYLYRIDCPTPLYQWGSSTFRSLPAPTTVSSDQDLSTSPVNRCLLTDVRLQAANDPSRWDARTSVNGASIIALSNHSSTCSEIAFLMAIPYAWIGQFRQANQPGAWVPMP